MLSKINRILKDILPIRPCDTVLSKYQLWQECHHKHKSYLDAYQLKGGTEDPDKHYYVFRWTLPSYAILSTGLKMLLGYEWAQKNNLIPIVDIEFEQVYANGELGTDNMWEYCFEQPCSLADIHKKKNVIVGPVIHGQKDWKYLRESCKKINDNDNDAYIHAVSDAYDNRAYYALLNTISMKVWKIQLPIENAVNSLSTQMFGGKKTMGLCLREEFNFGKNTNESSAWKVYRKHPASLEIEEICELIYKYMEKWDFEYIFVSTIYEDSIEKLREKFGDKVLAIKRKRKRIQESSEEFEKIWRLQQINEIKALKQYCDEIDPKSVRIEQTILYLQEILLLSKCDYFIGAKCSGTIAACAMNGGQFEDMCIIPDSRNSKKY